MTLDDLMTATYLQPSHTKQGRSSIYYTRILPKRHTACMACSRQGDSPLTHITQCTMSLTQIPLPYHAMNQNAMNEHPAFPHLHSAHSAIQSIPHCTLYYTLSLADDRRTATASHLHQTCLATPKYRTEALMNPVNDPVNSPVDATGTTLCGGQTPNIKSHPE